MMLAPSVFAATVPAGVGVELVRVEVAMVVACVECVEAGGVVVCVLGVEEAVYRLAATATPPMITMRAIKTRKMLRRVCFFFAGGCCWGGYCCGYGGGVKDGPAGG
jgi:hypothetical protein